MRWALALLSPQPGASWGAGARWEPRPPGGPLWARVARTRRAGPGGALPTARSSAALLLQALRSEDNYPSAGTTFSELMPARTRLFQSWSHRSVDPFSLPGPAFSSLPGSFPAADGQ